MIGGDVHGFATIPRALLHDPDAPPHAKLVFAVLSSHVGGNGYAWPSRARIAELVGCSVSQVKAMLKWLEGRGLVTVTRRQNPDGTWSTNQYRLTVGNYTEANKEVGQGVPYTGQDVTHLDGATPAEASEEVGQEVPYMGQEVTRIGQVVPGDGAGGDPERESVNESQNSGAPRKRAAAEKGTRIPDGWKRSELDVAWQRREQIPDAFARPVTAEFVNYWHAASGRNATKRDWSAAWKQWMSREWREKGPRWARDHEGADPAAEARVAARRRSPLPGAR